MYQRDLCNELQACEMIILAICTPASHSEHMLNFAILDVVMKKAAMLLPNGMCLLTYVLQVQLDHLHDTSAINAISTSI